jgi:ergothioneine biosynthesis protein EgtB
MSDTSSERREDHSALLNELEACWRRTDEIFGLLRPEAFMARPIPERQPFVFYLGHLPAFAWNLVCAGLLNRGGSRQPEFDDLFARGIDPPVTGAPPERETIARWPHVEDIHGYRDEVRAALRAVAEDVVALGDQHVMSDRGRVWHTVIEHEMEHHETLLYMLQHLEGPLKRPSRTLPPPCFEPAVAGRQLDIPAGRAQLGARFDDVPFGWDNEFPAREVDVPAFRIDSTPVMNGEFFEFMNAGGYENPAWWTSADWRWRRSPAIRHPASWRKVGEDWLARGLFEDLPLTRVFDWPVSVSWAEACAYLRWCGKRLPSEAEYHRAAFGTPDGHTNEHPWGNQPAEARHGNLDFHNWSPVPVGCHPDGQSAFGVHELVGNGWEWTSTRFSSYTGFEAYMPDYPGYSADFFDEEHHVMLGGSWATSTRLVRRSFRNWFRPHYAYAFTKFRGVTDI